MKTAAIVLMSIGLSVLIQNSHAADPANVFKILFSKTGNPKGIPREALSDYLIEQGWKDPRAGLIANQAAQYIADWEGLINKKKWNAMIKIATWLREGSNDSAYVWKQLGNKEKIPKGNLVKYMNYNKWNESRQGMAAKEAADHMARGTNNIWKVEWDANIQVVECIRIAK